MTGIGWKVLTLWFLTVLALTSCEARTRHEVLNFLFDGVPPLEQAKTGQAGTGASSQKNEAGSSRYTEHGPYAARLCDGCHEQHTNALIVPIEELCLRCHVFNMNAKNVHGPLASGGCIICHEPHGSANAYLLVSLPGEFCLYCHNRQDILQREIHRDEATACTECHSAHMTDSRFLLK